MTTEIAQTELPFPLYRRGKVRDVYDLGDALLMVATDRVSAFDVVLPQPVPRKGEVLTLVSAWWFARTRDLVANHTLTVDPAEIVRRFPELEASRQVWQRRSTLVRKLTPFPVECVVRGYISGSAWKEYAATATLAGESLAEGFRESDRLPEPIFSPATKAEEGHDENISFERMAMILGREISEALREMSLSVYSRGVQIAAERGLILADTKFEFGYDSSGAVFLIDEILTPDSSRFWPADGYRPGGPQPSFDKQPLRDFLDQLFARGEWDKQPPPPDLPDAVVTAASERYQELFLRLTGATLDEFPLSGESTT